MTADDTPRTAAGRALDAALLRTDRNDPSLLDALIRRAETEAEMRWFDHDMDRWVAAQRYLNALRQLADARLASEGPR